MYKLLSLPPNLVGSFHELENAPRSEWFCSSDPEGRKIGSGGGTAWLIDRWLEADGKASISEKKIIIHAGGQSRRLPSYAPGGKLLTPIPVFRWALGQRLGQNLLSLQLPLYEKIMEKAPEGLNTLIASGDVYIRAEKPLQEIPQADVVCYGLWVDADLATRHGVFVSRHRSPESLDFMLQKPSLRELEELSKTHLFLMDAGIWVLSDRAVRLLSKRSRDAKGQIAFYDLYSDFGRALGANPQVKDAEVNSLSVAVLPLPGGEFYHYGTSRELISSTLAVQNRILDQRRIPHRRVKPNPALFVQNTLIESPLSSDNGYVWIENSHIAPGWNFSSRHIVTGVPHNDWSISLPEGVCIDMVPIGDHDWAVRPYGMDDKMRGPLSSATYLERPFSSWLADRGVDMPDMDADIQTAPLFPVLDSMDDAGLVVRWMIGEEQDGRGKDLWLESPRISAEEITDKANLGRLYRQREQFAALNWDALAKNHEKSVFYQLDLEDVARNYHKLNIPAPEPLDDSSPTLKRIRNSMLRSRILSLEGRDGSRDEIRAFALLREDILAYAGREECNPHLNVHTDQIVWGRSPVRIDLAGGWTDTPPYSLFAGGNVVNVAIELNGQPPLQVYIKPSQRHEIVLRSIDMGAMETVDTYSQLEDYNKVGSPFSIPKAALTMAGFIKGRHATLRDQLRDFGAGIEITLLSAIPAGSGLGTSSILASTVLGALSDFCGLAWDKNGICSRTLALEQLLTTGGGWQDQYGGVLAGLKLLQTEPGFSQQPLVSWLPESIFTALEHRDCHLLYYTGITRTAKGILGEIVRSMFLNSNRSLSLLDEMKHHALAMAEAIQHCDFGLYGRLIAKTWGQNRRLDPGTDPNEVEAIIRRIKDYTLGCKLPGAGGGGYLYMVAKDPQCALRIREILTTQPPNPRARFVSLSLSDKGFQLSRS